MMAMNLLQIVVQAANELGLPPPAAVATSDDPQVKQLFALVNRDANDLYQSHDWTDLQFEFVINIGAPSVLIGNVSTGSAVVSGISSTAGIVANAFAVSGEGMPQAQRVVEVIDATSVRLSMEAIATKTGAALSFVRDTFDLPADFDHYITDTWWDRTNHWQLIGPISPQQSQALQSGIFATGPRRRWRQIGNQSARYRIWPPPSSNDTPSSLVFEYVSKNWVAKQDGTYDSWMRADSDIPIVDEQAMILGVKWRLWQVKGFAYADFQSEYVDYVNRLKARDGGMKTLSMNKRRLPLLITSAQIQDGYFPGR